MPDETGRLGEFELIGRLFAPLSEAAPGAFGLTDDAAVISPPAGADVVMTKDMMVAGVHFLPDDPPDLVARKLLRVNLSDLAGMGAAPHGYALGLGLPGDVGDDWLARFAAGLAVDQAEFRVALLGGDTTSTPGPLTLSLTAFGFAERGRLLRRAGARPGDAVCVTGTIGDAALGLRVLRGEIEDGTGFLAGRYRLPQPRLAVGLSLPGLASAGLDISDGLVADLGHLCEVSRVGAVVDVDRIPLSEPARRHLAARPALLQDVLGGGDDYELVCGIPPEKIETLRAHAARAGVTITRIGTVTPGGGVRVTDRSGREITVERAGFRHR